LDNNVLIEKAKATADLLVETMVEFPESIYSTYEEVLSEAPAKSEIQPREFSQSDFKRVLFEVLCFATYIIMGQEVPKFIVRRRYILGSTPDAEGIKYYNEKLFNYLQEYFENLKFGTIREIVITAMTPDIQFGLGEPLNAAKRVASYVQSGASLKAAKLFAQYLAYAVDAENYIFTKILGAYCVETNSGYCSYCP